LHSEVTLNKSCPVAVDGVYKVSDFFLAHAIGHETTHPFLSLGIEKDANRIGPIAEEVLRPSPDDYAISRCCRLLDDSLRDPKDTIGIQELQPMDIQTAFETTSHDRFEQSVIERVHMLLAGLELGSITMAQPGNLGRQRPVP
jgi:hypothetical protein